ncbi:site-specific integrase [Bacillus pakistanensis]|nr:site-specific integrase [Bacillus pakistanensis]
MKSESQKPKSPFYLNLKEKVDENILLIQDARGDFLLDKLHEQSIKYFLNYCLNKPWTNHLFLGILAETEKNLDVQTTYQSIKNINRRLIDIFNNYRLEDMLDFDVNIHLYNYLKASIFPEHSSNMRSIFFSHYKRVSYESSKWIKLKCNQEQQGYFEKFLIPLPYFTSRDFSFSKDATEQAHKTRKSETDAVVPLLPQIRAEAHFRWNQIKRIREAFLKAFEQVKHGKAELPLEIQYNEPARIGERFTFRLWDKPSFVIYHKDKFSDSIVKAAINHTGTYSDDNNHYFLEFLGAERVEDDDIGEGLWFREIIQKNLIGLWYRNISSEELEQKRQLLLSWGYGEKGSTSLPYPFHSQHKAILFQSTTVSNFKNKSGRVLFDIEPLYVATTFGLLALDVFTTTGARLNELLQISNTKECIRAIKVNKQTKFSFYVIPKGRDKVEPYYISDQTMKLIQSVAKMLREHYSSNKIPSVQYRDVRSHLFPEPKPYFFQYNYKALKRYTIDSCLHFLLHGLILETQEGIPVIIKSHLLRHAFATEAAQRQKIPIEIVAKMLHQRDVDVTGYYSEPTSSQVVQTVSDLHDVISDYVDLDEAILRSPKELQDQWVEYQEKVGIFNNVLGGICVEDAVCPIKMQCLGCRAKIPQPEKKHQLYEVIELSKDMEKRYSLMGLDVEVKKAKAMRKHARNELKEIELIEKYREEQNYEPHIRFQK